MAIISGSFSATGASPVVVGRNVAIDITLSAGGVDVEWCVDGENWRVVESFTESTQQVYESPGVPMRLNCTTYSSPISYAMRTY